MTDVYKAPFGTYAAMAGIVNVTGKAELATDFTNLKALIKPAAGQPAAHPDFNKIPAATRDKICAEIDAIAAVVAASASA